MSELGELPVELTERIFNDLNIAEVETFCSGRAKSSLKRRICFNQDSWRHFVLRDFKKFFNLQGPENGDWREYYYFLLDECLVANYYLAEWIDVEKKPGVRENRRKILVAEMLKDGALLPLEYVIDNYYSGKYKFESSNYHTAVGGSLETLKFVVEKSEWRHDTAWKNSLCELAASNGRPDALKYLHEQGFPWNGAVLLNSIRSNCMRCFEYAHNHGCKLPRNEILSIVPDGDDFLVSFRKDYYSIHSIFTTSRVNSEFGEVIAGELRREGVRIL